MRDRTEYNRAYYLANRGKSATRDQARYLANREERLVKMREYSKSPEGISVKQAYAKARVGVTMAWRERNPEKRRAHSLLYYAVQCGKIKRPDACPKCGRECLVEGHHADYSKPLEVDWLCRSCHVLEHRARSL